MCLSTTRLHLSMRRPAASAIIHRQGPFITIRIRHLLPPHTCDGENVSALHRMCIRSTCFPVVRSFSITASSASDVTRNDALPKFTSDVIPAPAGDGQHGSQHRAHRGFLRPYQEACIAASLEHRARGVMRQAVSLPVGSGKTVVFSHLISRLQPTVPGATKTLVLAHRMELLEQTTRQVGLHNPHLRVELEQGSQKASRDADVIVASVATLGRKDSPRLLSMNPNEFKLIVIDEAHHAVAPSYIRILDHFGLGKKETGTHVMLWGCTATLVRHDARALGTVFDEIVYARRTKEMIEENWLCPAKVSVVATGQSIANIRKTGEDYNTSRLSQELNNPIRNALVVKAWKELAADRKSTLVFAIDVDHGINLVRAFKHEGVHAEAVFGHTSSDERILRVHTFRQGKYPVLVNCAVFTEGTDIPNIDCVLLARPTRSKGLLIQMAGRGLRLSPAKTDCAIIDIADNFPTGQDRATLDGFFDLSVKPLEATKQDHEGAADDIAADEKGTESRAIQTDADCTKASASVKPLALQTLTYDFCENPPEQDEDPGGKNSAYPARYFDYCCVSTEPIVCLRGPYGPTRRVYGIRSSKGGVLTEIAREPSMRALERAIEDCIRQAHGASALFSAAALRGPASEKQRACLSSLMRSPSDPPIPDGLDKRAASKLISEKLCKQAWWLLPSRVRAAVTSRMVPSVDVQSAPVQATAPASTVAVPTRAARRLDTHTHAHVADTHTPM